MSMPTTDLQELGPNYEILVCPSPHPEFDAVCHCPIKIMPPGNLKLDKDGSDVIRDVGRHARFQPLREGHTNASQ